MPHVLPPKGERTAPPKATAARHTGAPPAESRGFLRGVSLELELGPGRDPGGPSRAHYVSNGKGGSSTRRVPSASSQAASVLRVSMGCHESLSSSL